MNEKCVDCDVEGVKLRGRPKITWTEVIDKDMMKSAFKEGRCRRED